MTDTNEVKKKSRFALALGLVTMLLGSHTIAAVTNGLDFKFIFGSSIVATLFVFSGASLTYYIFGIAEKRALQNRNNVNEKAMK